MKTVAQPWSDYELLDAGGGRKLERWGAVITIRPDVNAYFRQEWPEKKWKELAHWEFKEAKDSRQGNWVKYQDSAPDTWIVQFNDVQFILSITKFKHVGLFPEQQANWSYLKSIIKPKDKVINLFAYTGAASCISKSCYADVVHVDSVKQLIGWARENMEQSQLEDIRWVHDDALKFAQREQKRGNKYDVVMMDPPAWGIGTKNEKWKLEDKLDELVKLAYDILNPNGTLICNTYSPKIQAETLETIACKVFPYDQLEVTELWTKSKTGKDLFHGLLLRAKK